MGMKRLLAGLLALLLLGLVAPALGATHTRVSGRLLSPVPRPAPPACRGNRARDALGRCPAPPACLGGRAREPGGQCPTIFCAGGVLPDAFGRCHAPATPRRPCPSGGLRTPAGDCPTPPPCPGGLTRNFGGVCPFFAPRHMRFAPTVVRRGVGLAPPIAMPALRPTAPRFAAHPALRLLPAPAPHVIMPPLHAAPPAPRIAPPLAH
jgi:hypothetical protein